MYIVKSHISYKELSEGSMPVVYAEVRNLLITIGVFFSLKTKFSLKFVHAKYSSLFGRL